MILARENQPYRLFFWKIVRLTIPHLFFYSFHSTAWTDARSREYDLIILHQIDRFVNVLFKKMQRQTD